MLYWANAMVLSRCFHLWDQRSDGSKNFKGGMCPFIDLINHDFDPKCVKLASGVSQCAWLKLLSTWGGTQRS